MQGGSTLARPNVFEEDLPILTEPSGLILILHQLKYMDYIQTELLDYLTIIPRARMGSESIAAEWAISEAMRARGIIVLVKSN